MQQQTELQMIQEFVHELSYNNRYVVFNTHLRYKASYNSLSRAIDMRDFNNKFFKGQQVGQFKIYDKEENKIICTE